MNRCVKCLISATIFTAPASARAGVVAHYPLNAGARDLVSARDGHLVGDARYDDATPTSVVTLPSALTGGASLSLDGAFDKLVYDVPVGDTVQGSYSVAAWINPQERRTTGTLAFFGTRQPETHGFDVKIHADRTIRIDVGDGAGWLAITDKAFTYELDTWYHFAVAISPSNYAIYLNGEPFDSGPLTGTPLLWDANHDIAIGAVGDVTHPHGEDFHGLIDDVWVFDEALSRDRVRAVMHRLLGDADLNGAVDIEDLNLVRNNFGGQGSGDTDDDGLVDLRDLNNVRNQFGMALPAQFTAVPEPAAIVQIVIVVTATPLMLRATRRFQNRSGARSR